MEFRKDVEGLRAVAVIPILLFHAGVSQLAGGFAGVDIFFVISGFLITKIIFNGLKQDKFSILRFYSRRMVRIFPLLFFVILTCNVIGYFVFYPADKALLGESSIYTALLLSNFYFWRNVDYFLPSSQYTPLLHTWSLGIEEQFYIFFPLLLVIGFKWFRRVKPLAWLILGLSLLSFALAWWLSVTDRERTAFYVLLPRAWELGIGSIVALGGFPAIHSARMKEIVTGFALAAITFSIVAIRPDFTIPAPWMLLPCLATAVLISYGPGTFADRLLSISPLRRIGRMSYAIYLWHWPIIVFYKVYLGYKIFLDHSLTLLNVAVCVGLTLAAAAASTFLIERPLIRRFREARPQQIFAASFSGMAAVVAIGVSMQRHPGGPQDYPAAVGAALRFSSYETTDDYRRQFRPGICFITTFDRPADPDCTKLDETRPNVVLAGDSLAAQYWRALQDRFPEHNIIQATAPSCRPTVQSIGAALCRANVSDVLARLVPSERTQTVILAAWWRPSDLEKLSATIRLIQSYGKRLILVGPTLNYDVEYPAALATAIAKGNLDLLETLRNKETPPLEEQMRGIATQFGIEFVSSIDILCGKGPCAKQLEDGTPLHFDKTHFTLAASRKVVAQFPEL